MQCPKCGALNEDASDFCGLCYERFNTGQSCQSGMQTGVSPSEATVKTMSDPIAPPSDEDRILENPELWKKLAQDARQGSAVFDAWSQYRNRIIIGIVLAVIVTIIRVGIFSGIQNLTVKVPLPAGARFVREETETVTYSELSSKADPARIYVTNLNLQQVTDFFNNKLKQHDQDTSDWSGNMTSYMKEDMAYGKWDRREFVGRRSMYQTIKVNAYGYNAELPYPGVVKADTLLSEEAVSDLRAGGTLIAVDVSGGGYVIDAKYIPDQ